MKSFFVVLWMNKKKQPRGHEVTSFVEAFEFVDKATKLAKDCKKRFTFRIITMKEFDECYSNSKPELRATEKLF